MHFQDGKAGWKHIFSDENITFAEKTKNEFVMQELMACGVPDLKVHYWAPDVGEAELDFVIETGGYVAPLEAKAEQNLKAKSLKSFSQKYKTAYIFRTSISPYFKGDTVTDIPLFAVTKTVSLLNQD